MMLALRNDKGTRNLLTIWEQFGFDDFGYDHLIKLSHPYESSLPATAFLASWSCCSQSFSMPIPRLMFFLLSCFVDFVWYQAISPVREFITVAERHLVKLITNLLQAIFNFNDLLAFADQPAWECRQGAICNLNHFLNMVDLHPNSIVNIIYLKAFHRLKYCVQAMVSKAAFVLIPVI